MNRFTRLLASTLVAALASLVLVACSGNAIIPARGDGGTSQAGRCTPGVFFSSGICRNVTCPAGQTADRLCDDSGLIAESPCQCHGAQTSSEMCLPTTVRVSTRMTCPAGQTPQETCNAQGQWASFECVGRTQFCAPNSWTDSSLCRGIVCDAGRIARQHCSADGQTYEACECVPGNGATICAAGTARNPCGFSCGNGTVVTGTEVCNSTGSAYECRQNAGTSCSGAMTACTAGVSNGAACSNACAAGSEGRLFCNGSGSAYDQCRCVPVVSAFCTPGNLYTTGCPASCSSGQVAQQRCNATGSGYESVCQCTTVTSGGTGSCGGGTLIVRAVDTGRLVRCYGNGQTWTSSNNELRAALDGNQCGYTECVTGTLASNGQFVEDAFWGGQNTGAITSVISFASVEGRAANLVNQTTVARLCLDTRSRTKAVIAVNSDRLGLCQGG